MIDNIGDIENTCKVETNATDKTIIEEGVNALKQ